MEDNLLTANEVARLLAIQPSTVYAGAAKGHIPCVRLWKGRNWSLLRFRREDIDTLIREGRGLGPCAEEPQGGDDVQGA